MSWSLWNIQCNIWTHTLSTYERDIFNAWKPISQAIRCVLHKYTYIYMCMPTKHCTSLRLIGSNHHSALIELSCPRVDAHRVQWVWSVPCSEFAQCSGRNLLHKITRELIEHLRIIPWNMINACTHNSVCIQCLHVQTANKLRIHRVILFQLCTTISSIDGSHCDVKEHSRAGVAHTHCSIHIVYVSVRAITTYIYLHWYYWAAFPHLHVVSHNMIMIMICYVIKLFRKLLTVLISVYTN